MADENGAVTQDPPNPGPAEDNNDDFTKAFEEFAGGPDEGDPADNHEDNDEGNQGGDPGDGGGTDDGQKTQGQPSGDPAARTENQQDDIWKGLTPEQRAEVDRLAHENASHRGRTSKLMKEHPELFTGQPARPTQQPPAQQPGADGKGQGAAGQGQQRQGASGAAADDEDADLKKFREEYPDVAEPVLKLVDGIRAENAALKSELGNFSAVARQANDEKQFNIFANTHNDWKTVLGSDAFEQWLTKQPDYVIQAAVRNGDKVVDGEEAAHVVSLFKASESYKPPQPQPKPTNQPGQQQQQRPAASNGNGNGAGAAPNQAPPQQNGNSRKTRRQQQLGATTTTPRRGVGAASGPPDDFETAFKFYADRPAPN